MNIRRELETMGFSPKGLTEIRSKDGVHVWRFVDGSRRLVIKVLERQADRRELANYALLQQLGLQTLPVLAATEKSLVLPDLQFDPGYRLGEEADLRDPLVAAALGHWYRQLHGLGRSWVRDHGREQYDEADLLTAENLELVRQRTGTEAAPFWSALCAKWAAFSACVQAAGKTMTYNDFYYTNLVVARDRSAAFPFDYNWMGKGCVLADLGNVTYYMDDRAKAAFYEAYGPVEDEDRDYDAVVSPLVTLVQACRAEALPPWAEAEIEKLRSGELLRALERFLEETDGNSTCL